MPADAFQLVTSRQLEMTLEKANQEHKRCLEQEKVAHQAREAAAQEIQHQNEAFFTALKSIEQYYMERRAQFEAGYRRAWEAAEIPQHSLSMEKENGHYKIWQTRETIAYEGLVAEARENHVLALEGANKEYKRRLAEEAAAVEASEIAARECQRQLQNFRKEEAEFTEQYTVLGESSLITCCAGIDIQNVVTGFDISRMMGRIIIKNLPRDTKHKEISDILVHYGMTTSDFFVHDVRFRSNCREATVLVITDHGREIAAGLEDAEFRDHQGLGRLRELLGGEENVVLSFVSGQWEITIKGGEEERHHLKRLIKESQVAQTMEQIHPEKDEKVTCPICYDEVSHPEQLGCGHIYCSACLRHFLASAPETKTFPLVCLGDETACKMPISLPFIQRFMTPQAFQALVEAAFRSYLDQHSQELKYCTTPDCQQIYRHSPETHILQCPSCFSSICSACDDEAHEGLTCKERRDQKNSSEQDRLFNEWVDAHGKRCPECKSVIEKNGGCNNIACRCGANFCWACGKTFRSDEIYQHMNTVHGGIN